MTSRLRALLIAGAVAAVTFNVVTFYVNGWPGPASPAIYVISPTLVLLAYLITGIVSWQVYPGLRVGLLFTVAGYVWLLPSLTQLHYPLPYTIGNLTWTLYQASLAHLALAWPYGRLRSRLDGAVVAANYGWNVVNNAVRMLFWNPRTSGCSAACPANLLLVDDSSRAQSDISSVVSIVGICITVAIAALIAAHWRSAHGYSRRSMTHLIWVAMPIAAYIAVMDIPGSLGLSNLLLLGIGPLILTSAPAAYGIGLLRTRSARGAVGVALVGLEPGPAPARLRDALAGALGDPELQLAFRVPDRGCYVDTGDLPVDAGLLPEGRMLTPLDPGADAVLVHDDELRHEPELIRVAVAAANLALEHSRLQAEIEAQLEQVRASRARIVEAGDTARRRLERDLHDGAQQRLVTLSLALGMARSQAAGNNPELESLLESASKEAREAIVELRELARGLHPAVLTEAGLPGAIQALAERSAVTTVINEVPPGRLPAPIEATAYFVVSEALANVAKHAPAATARITIRQQASELLVEVTDDGPGGAQADAGSGLRGLADRVASVGGALRIDSPRGSGTRLEAQIPCQ
jgi:signal transduction histidine kinase